MIAWPEHLIPSTMPKQDLRDHPSQKQSRRKSSDKAKESYELKGKMSSKHIRIQEAQREARKTKEPQTFSNTSSIF